MKQSHLHQLTIAAVAAFVFFTRLGATQLWDEDEAFFAATAAEMQHRGEWIVPWYNGEVFAHKPPMMYWMMRIGFLMFGEHEFGARFFSAVFGVATALLTYHIGRRLFDAEAAFWAGLAMSSCVMFSVVARASTADSYLVFFMTLSLWAYLRCTPCFTAENRAVSVGQNSTRLFARQLPATRWQWLTIYALMGLAVLVKGPIGVLLPGMTIGLFLLCSGGGSTSTDSDAAPRWKRAARWLVTHFHPQRVVAAVRAMQPLLAITAVALVAGPWFVLVGLRTDGTFLAEFFGTHNFGRFLSPMENHRGPIIYYVPIALAGFFPWSIFVLPTILHLVHKLRKGAHESAAWLFLACWVVAVVGFFSIASTKLPNYILPAYPAFALITGGYLRDWLRSPARQWRYWPQLAYGSLVVIGLAVTTAILVLTQVESNGQPVMTHLNVNAAVVSSAAQLWWLGLPLMLCGSTALWMLHRMRLKTSLVVFGCGCPVFVASLLIVAAERINPHQTSSQLVNFIDDADPASPIAVLSHSPPSLVFYAREPVARLCDDEDIQTYFESHPNGSLVATDEGWERVSDEIEAAGVVVHEIPRFPKPGAVLIIQCSHCEAPAVIQQASASVSPPPMQ